MFTSWRRRKLRSQPLPAGWRRLIEEGIPLLRRLPAADREELDGHVLVFLAEKRFEGLGGLTITDEVRVTVAAQACLLLLHRRTDYFPGLFSILVYPGEFIAPVREERPGGIVAETEELRAGESWPRGSLVLAWDDVLEGSRDPGDGYNVVLHEFAHQLDDENGASDGVPLLEDRELRGEWSRVFSEEFRRLKRDSRLGRRTLLDPYGAENPPEFFAVATEHFFEQPRELESEHPDLYRLLGLYYRQDPAAWAD